MKKKEKKRRSRFEPSHRHKKDFSNCKYPMGSNTKNQGKIVESKKRRLGGETAFRGRWGGRKNSFLKDWTEGETCSPTGSLTRLALLLVG